VAAVGAHTERVQGVEAARGEERGRNARVEVPDAIDRRKVERGDEHAVTTPTPSELLDDQLGDAFLLVVVRVTGRFLISMFTSAGTAERAWRSGWGRAA
jgi:hypothetical protein